MVTSNVLHRVFRLKHGDAHGTCFTVDVDRRQYIITAAHLVQGIGETDIIEIYYNGAWTLLGVRLVGISPAEADVAVLAATTCLSPEHPLPATGEGIIVGQDVYFLGFPYNLFVDVGKLNRDFPLPFIKKAIVSSMERLPSGVELFYLDGHNNPGFSGGPVVWSRPNQLRFSVVAVVSGFRASEEPVYSQGQPTELAYLYNTGIILAGSIEHATALIAINPIGCELGR